MGSVGADGASTCRNWAGPWVVGAAGSGELLPKLQRHLKLYRLCFIIFYYDYQQTRILEGLY